ncbi:MAG: hypothetical protein V3R85_02690 [Alphaproteobacteria bacterium]
MSNEWEFLGVCYAEAPFRIGKIKNIWDHEWQEIKGQQAHVKDPTYRQDFTFDVYKIITDEDEIEFTAGEFSNQVWGIYARRL